MVSSFSLFLTLWKMLWPGILFTKGVFTSVPTTAFECTDAASFCKSLVGEPSSTDISGCLLTCLPDVSDGLYVTFNLFKLLARL